MATTAVAGYNVALTEMAMGYFRSRALCAAARLGVADALGDQERSVEELAAACGADAPSLRRLLRALASVGVVAEPAPSRFVLTPFGRPLRRDVPGSAWAGVVFWGDLLADAWSFMTDCVRTGRPAGAVRPEGVPSRWEQDPDAGSIFRAVMGTSPADDYLPIAQAWDFGRFGTVADLGGGGGALIAAILQAHPGVRGMLVDREDAVAEAAPRFADGALADRCRLVAADLMHGVPPGADVYVLKHVLHGYGDDAAREILGQCQAVVPAAGRLLIVEFVLPDVVDGPDADLEQRLMSDLNMLAVTGGRERSAMEWTALLESAGFELRGIVPVPGDLVSIVEAAPAA